MSAYMISAQYGELIEGYSATRREMLPLLSIPEPNRTAQQRERLAFLSVELSDWQDVMRRCPKFQVRV